MSAHGCQKFSSHRWLHSTMEVCHEEHLEGPLEFGGHLDGLAVYTASTILKKRSEGPCFVSNLRSSLVPASLPQVHSRMEVV